MTTTWPLWAFAAVAAFTPGAATVLVIASGARFGLLRSLPLVLGLGSGLGLLGCLVGSGLGAALLVLPSVQDMLRVLGSAYLLWLAGRIARAGPPCGSTAAPGGVLLGLLLTLQNPKAWAVTLSAAASFSGLAEGPAGLALLLGSSFGACALLALSFWCMAGQEMGRRLHSRQQWAIVNGTLGALLAASVIPIWL
ncbi:amino acid transporter [Siccirubricoccus deserti]|uniref:LysE family transporter n=1 Tax=Siccirubricoccus deserti TaxID=2013562 RepID=A0A9X0R390_9PROT|nr:LysE family transporter [Siccirubricoccus deserti]MBC4019041.1 LysE family transporter [Siccirubricoccus deserti]GGC70661.1 amino acid transporter [Siccirubricoccus deserti]